MTQLDILESVEAEKTPEEMLYEKYVQVLSECGMPAEPFRLWKLMKDSWEEHRQKNKKEEVVS